MLHWSRIRAVLRSCFLFQKVAGFDALNFDLLVAGFDLPLTTSQVFAHGAAQSSTIRIIGLPTNEYERHGTTTLFAALKTATGLVKAGHYKRRRPLLSKKGSKKVLTKRPPFLVKSLVCKSSEKTVNGGWRDGRTLEPF